MSIYLDNAATSFPKPEVVADAMTASLKAGGSPGRGFYSVAMDADRLRLDVRQSLGLLLGGVDAARIVFMANATQALNQALFGLSPRQHILTTSMEHNAVLRPLHLLKQRGVRVTTVPALPDGTVPAERVLELAQQHRVDLVVMSHVSNVSGTIQPVGDIGPWCRQHGIPLLVDASQSVGHVDIDVEAMGIDLLAAPGHKGLLGPQGTGFLYVRPGLELTPLIFGGTGVQSSALEMPEQMPERLEPGTPNMPGIAGLGAAVTWLREQGVGTLQGHIHERLRQLWNGLQHLPGVRLYGPDDLTKNAGVVSMTWGDHDSAEIGFRLDREFGIQTRVGLHCAPEAHRTLGTYPGGTVRFSPGPFTTAEDLDAVLTAFRTLAKTY